MCPCECLSVFRVLILCRLILQCGEVVEKFLCGNWLPFLINLTRLMWVGGDSCTSMAYQRQVGVNSLLELWMLEGLGRKWQGVGRMPNWFANPSITSNLWLPKPALMWLVFATTSSPNSFQVHQTHPRPSPWFVNRPEAAIRAIRHQNKEIVRESSVVLQSR